MVLYMRILICKGDCKRQIFLCPSGIICGNKSKNLKGYNVYQGRDKNYPGLLVRGKEVLGTGIPNLGIYESQQVPG